MSQYQYEVLHIDDDPLEAVRFDTLKEARFNVSIRSGMHVYKISKGWECNYLDGDDDEARLYKTKREAYFNMECRSGYVIYKVRRD